MMVMGRLKNDFGFRQQRYKRFRRRLQTEVV